MYLKACLNGARTPTEHGSLPVTAAQIAADVAAVNALGVNAVHVHVKDPRTGADTFEPATTDEVMTHVRRAAPGLPIGVTTGAWAEPDVAARVAAIRRWSVLPDFASVNWHEDGAEQVGAALVERGIGVEAGLWHVDAARAWRASPLRQHCVRILLELQNDGDEAEAHRLLDACGTHHGTRTRVVLHGEGDSCWPVLRLAYCLGLGSRIGLEDTLVLPDGSPAPDNAALVRAAQSLASVCPGRGSPSQYRPAPRERAEPEHGQDAGEGDAADER